MIQLLYQGQWFLFCVILSALVVSLSCHEFGHAWVARRCGDNTAQRAGRLTLNPLAHIDPMGLLMVMIVGFGYAKPVPTDPRRFTSRYAELLVAAAGPAMNFVLAFVAVNIYLQGLRFGWYGPFDVLPQSLVFVARINLLLMVFNLLPIGALDGHYILPYFLPRGLSQRYRYFNARYGNLVLLALIGLAVLGVPVLAGVWRVSDALLPMVALTW
ncbi:MAG: site-2 protease family protein [Proteobacteria bacterium]|nr:site-2 protease family protein [Pseudomonadota bacterium]MBP10085.1 site-2 protease family protein [Acidiferrobacteraceae bacterium]MDP6137725.1 site-2 protease family protein [Arenicellales bacterium]|tara:strand:- start:593 stop:1234 length:642 start_codon:yes stop_codon:yes gene_type:complete